MHFLLSKSFLRVPRSRPFTVQLIAMAKLHIIFAGNPGVGKSTILNSLTGLTTPVFRSGVSISTGMTTVMQTHETPNFILGDTPGLMDVRTKERAAQEIVACFRSAKFLKLIFVVTLESGRIRPADATTIDLILSAFDGVDMTNKFGIVINKVSGKVKTKILADNDLITTFGALNMRFKTCHIVINDFNAALNDEDDIVVPTSEPVARLLYCIETLQVGNISEIRVDEAQKLREEYEAKIEELYRRQEQESAKLRSEFEAQKQHLIAQAQAAQRVNPFTAILEAFVAPIVAVVDLVERIGRL